jgi:hypothetical protein
MGFLDRSLVIIRHTFHHLTPLSSMRAPLSEVSWTILKACRPAFDPGSPRVRSIIHSPFINLLIFMTT